MHTHTYRCVYEYKGWLGESNLVYIFRSWLRQRGIIFRNTCGICFQHHPSPQAPCGQGCRHIALSASQLRNSGMNFEGEDRSQLIFLKNLFLLIILLICICESANIQTFRGLEFEQTAQHVRVHPPTPARRLPHFLSWGTRLCRRPRLQLRQRTFSSTIMLR